MIYLDYAATNPFIQYSSASRSINLNPNANYSIAEATTLDQYKHDVKEALGAISGKVLFGGSSSQLIENLYTMMPSIHRILASKYEHESCWRFQDFSFNCLHNLEDELKQHEWPQRVVFWQGVNNVTGEIFPVKEIGELCHKYNAYYVCDMTAMIGHAKIPDGIDFWCDCAIWSGHKLGTAPGLGAMWLSDKFTAWLKYCTIYGTPNLVGAKDVTDATYEACDNVERNMRHIENNMPDISALLDMAGIEHTIINHESAPKTPAITAIRLHGISADTLQSYLASKQIYIGIGGSACAAEHDYRVLNAYGLSDKEAEEVVRISYGSRNSMGDVLTLVKEIQEFKRMYT